MTVEDNEYALGEDVTELAAPKTRKGSAILSVRVSDQELAAIEAASRATGKSISQFVREAVAGYLRAAPQGAATVTVSVRGGNTLSTGPVGVRGQAAHAETIPDPDLSAEGS